MARRISKVITASVPQSIYGQFNHSIAKGLAHLDSQKIPELIHNILKSAFSDPSLGLIYNTCSVCSPDEGAEEVHKASSSGYDISQSDMYLMKYNFTYGATLDKTIDRYRWTPFIRPGNIIMVGGSSLIARPVISDKIISPGSENTFIRLLRAKIALTKSNYSCSANGQRTLDMSVPEMSMFTKKVTSKATNCRGTVLLYILGQYGLRKTAELLHLPAVTPMHYIDSINLDRNRYVVYSSALKPGTETPDTLVLVINAMDRSNAMDQFMCNVFYLLDNYQFSLGEMDNIGSWRRLLGLILYGDKNAFWITQHMDRQYDSWLNAYMPTVMVDMIKLDFGDLIDHNLHQDGFFKILLVTFMNYDKWLSIAGEISASAYDKSYTVNYYLLYDTITKINKIVWELYEAKENNTLTDSFILKCLRRNFTLRGVYRLNDISNLSAMSLSSHTSNYLVKQSTMMSLQLNANGATGAQRKGNGPIADPTTLLHETHLIAGTLSAIGSKRMSPLSTANIFAPLDVKTRTIIPSDIDLCHLESIREVLACSPNRSEKGNIPELFNRFVKYPDKPPQDW